MFNTLAFLFLCFMDRFRHKQLVKGRVTPDISYLKMSSYKPFSVSDN